MWEWSIVMVLGEKRLLLARRMLSYLSQCYSFSVWISVHVWPLESAWKRLTYKAWDRSRLRGPGTRRNLKLAYLKCLVLVHKFEPFLEPSDRGVYSHSKEMKVLVAFLHSLSLHFDVLPEMTDLKSCLIKSKMLILWHNAVY